MHNNEFLLWISLITSFLTFKFWTIIQNAQQVSHFLHEKFKKKLISNRVQVPLKRTHLTLKFSKVIWRHFWEEFYVKWNIDWTKDYRHMTNNYMNDKIKINKLSKQLQMKLSNFLRIIQNNKSSFMFRSYNSCILLYNILYWSFTVFGLILR